MFKNALHVPVVYKDDHEGLIMEKLGQILCDEDLLQ